MKWIFAFIAFCFVVVPVMGATDEANAQALVIFDVLLTDLNVMSESDARTGDLITRVANVFFEGSNHRRGNKPLFLTELMDIAFNVPANLPGVDECYGCAPLYVIDSVTTLFYLSSVIKNADSMNFVLNLDYLEYLIIQMESYGLGSYGSIDSGYIDALKAAADGWEEVRRSPENNAHQVAVFENLLTDLSVLSGNDAKSGDLYTRLVEVFFSENTYWRGGNSFLAYLMHNTLKNGAASSAGVDECYECSSMYLIDSVTTLFYLAGTKTNTDQAEEEFTSNLAYLIYLTSEMEEYGGVESGYIDALKTAIDGWEEVYGAQTPTETYVSDEHLSDVLEG
jgi:hypothetical protein